MTSRLLHHAVERIAEHTPEREAVCFDGQTLTYGELARRASRLAHVLRERGVSRGDRVGILANKGLHSAVAMYGIMKAGAAYVPLDALAPTDRLCSIIRDCSLSHLVSEPTRVDTVRALVAAGAPLTTVIGMEDVAVGAGRCVPWSQIENAPMMTTWGDASEMDLSYILYTSGSTGTPKGVVHTHRSALAFAAMAAQTFGLRHEDRVTNHAPLHFDLSTLDFFATALVGGTTVVVPEAHTRLPASLATLLERERVTVTYAVPLALTQLALHGALELRNLSALRWVIFAGEPFPPKHLRTLMRALPAASYANIYGPTEVNGVTVWVVPTDSALPDTPLPIGRPFTGVTTKIVDELGTAVAPGELGELWVSSPTSMQGYWGRPDLDAAAFATTALAGEGECVWHRTGDLVRQDADGELHFFGRKDRQIKARGYRVELDEVEGAFLTHPAVEAAAVYGVPDAMGVTAIEATIVLASGSTTTARDLIAHAARVLPRYALPEQVQITDALPRTATEKIDRQSLRASALARRAATMTGTP